MGDQFDELFDIVKERIRDNANLSLKAKIQTAANKKDIQVNASDIQCAKLEIKVHQGKFESLEGQLRLQQALRESLEQRVEKLETLVQQKEDKIQALTDKVEAVYQPRYPEIVAEVIPAS